MSSQMVTSHQADDQKTFQLRQKSDKRMRKKVNIVKIQSILKFVCEKNLLQDEF